MITLPGSLTVVAAGVFGFCAAYILVVSFALPALLVGPAGAPRLSAGMFAISYTLAFVVTLLAGPCAIRHTSPARFCRYSRAVRSSRCSGRGCIR